MTIQTTTKHDFLCPLIQKPLAQTEMKAAAVKLALMNQTSPAAIAIYNEQ